MGLGSVASVLDQVTGGADWRSETLNLSGLVEVCIVEKACVKIGGVASSKGIAACASADVAVLSGTLGFAYK